MTRITRLEVITDTGRDYVCWEEDNDITVSYQDDGRTLKVFVNKVEPKSPAEEAYKAVYGWYPPTTPSVSNYEDNRWSAFQNGYNASKEECKVEEEPKPTPETLYQMFNDEKWSKCGCDHICKVVEEWMSQYTCETNKWDEDYKCGFLDCLDVLRKNLK